MSNLAGRIILKNIDMMGYGPDNRVFKVTNGGIGSGIPRAERNTFEFLQQIGKFLDDSGSLGYTIHCKRLNKFIAFCEDRGFMVEVGA